MKHYQLLAACLFISALSSISSASLPNEIQTNSGPITGVEEYGVRVFKGVPYAAPPVGELRWKAPQPPVPWTEPLACDEFGPACPQNRDPKIDLLGDAPVSEDCLFLNVWTPAQSSSDLLPVMVWCHGSGFLTGSGSQSFYDGTMLALEGVVVVTFNYRLGALGFMVHPDLRDEASPKTAGNYGFLDHIATLQWVRDNIVQFGGDPNCVTVFGESAGGSTVSLLLSCPLAKGLFHRAIAESGSLIGNLGVCPEANGSWAQAVRNGYEIQKRLGFESVANPIESMRQVPVEDILSAVADMQFGPVMDGWCYPTTPRNMWTEQRIVNKVPLLQGTNSDDGAFWGDENATVDDYLMYLDYFFGENAEAVYEHFPVTPETYIPELHAEVMTHFMFGEPERFLSRTLAAQDIPVYSYFYSYIPPQYDRCYHGVEVEYVFGNVWEELGFTDADREFSAILRRYWVNFATTGDPNGEGLPTWPQYTLPDEIQMHISNDGISSGPRLFQNEYDIIETYAPRLIEDFPDIADQPSNCMYWELY